MDDIDQATRALVGTSKRDPSALEASDPRSTAELVALYLSDPETHEAGQALGILHYRGGREEFEIAAHLAKSNLAQERRVAADILAQLGWQDRTFLSDSIEILLHLLDDSESTVLQAAAIACGHRKSAQRTRPRRARSRFLTISIAGISRGFELRMASRILRIFDGSVLAKNLIRTTI